MAPLIAVLIGAAAKVGAPIVKSLLENALGETAGGVAGTVIDAIASEAGVAPAELPGLPAQDLEKAVAAVEPVTPALVDAYVRQQAETNRLMLAEMDKGQTWTWAWRPAGMWLFFFFLGWMIVIVPAINLFLSLFGASAQMVLIVDVATVVTLFVTYIGLYMGGHTVKDAVSKWTAKP